MKQRQHSQKLILGGEVHNSTASSIAYMEEKVCGTRLTKLRSIPF